MKYALLIGDGMADFPQKSLDNKTPLEYALTPHMDACAHDGIVGKVQTVPSGMPPGSDVANMSLMGYDPQQYYDGRAPIEAASMGVDLRQGDKAFRCNLVNLDSKNMVDYSSGHIETDDAHAIIGELKESLDSDSVCFHPGVSYRHLAVVSDFPEGDLKCTPPHDISGREYKPFLPQGTGQERVLDLFYQARDILARSPVNKKRISRGKCPVTDIWLWGQGSAIALPTLAERYSLSGSVVSAVDLVKGLGVLAGLTVCNVPGATGYLDTNYAGKVSAAATALETQDFVYLHVEAPDETSHEGSLEKKITAIEAFDRNVVGEIRKLKDQMKDLRICVLPDHATPVSMKTHHDMPVPYAMCGTHIAANHAQTYCEKSAHDSEIVSGVELFDRFIKGNFD
ncbi:MAG: cofactor-independent phosphoglycerate mutase [Chitinivibrionales bacterium]|nr:cofactor-independent phosphoglycerate mutase [Chitinivibrionales bacterium]